MLVWNLWKLFTRVWTHFETILHEFHTNMSHDTFNAGSKNVRTIQIIAKTLVKTILTQCLDNESYTLKRFKNHTTPFYKMFKQI